MNLLNFFKSSKNSKKDDLFNSHPDGIFIVESDGRILDVNVKITDLFKNSRYDMIGQFFSKFVQGGSSLLNVIVNSKSSMVAKAITEPDREVFLELTASQNSVSKNVYVCTREVTSNYKSQSFVNLEFAACKKIVDDKNLYLASISNDILSPLNSIVGFSKALIDGIGGELLPKQEKYVQIISKNSEELNYDLSKILTYFKLESKLVEYEPKNFDVINQLNSALKPYEEQFKKKMLHLTYDFTNLASRNCFHDPNVIADIIASLVEVAYKNMDVGTCSISATNPSFEFLQNNDFKVADENDNKKYIMFEVKDSSTCYSEEELRNILNPYYILTQEANKREIGSKFVLSIIEKHLKQLGGKIWVNSRPMQGNTVSIVIPTEIDVPVNK